MFVFDFGMVDRVDGVLGSWRKKRECVDGHIILVHFTRINEMSPCFSSFTMSCSTSKSKMLPRKYP